MKAQVVVFWLINLLCGIFVVFLLVQWFDPEGRSFDSWAPGTSGGKPNLLWLPASWGWLLIPAGYFLSALPIGFGASFFPRMRDLITGSEFLDGFEWILGGSAIIFSIVGGIAGLFSAGPLGLIAGFLGGAVVATFVLVLVAIPAMFGVGMPIVAGVSAGHAIWKLLNRGSVLSGQADRVEIRMFGPKSIPYPMRFALDTPPAAGTGATLSAASSCESAPTAKAATAASATPTPAASSPAPAPTVPAVPLSPASTNASRQPPPPSPPVLICVKCKHIASGGGSTVQRRRFQAGLCPLCEGQLVEAAIYRKVRGR